MKISIIGAGAAGYAAAIAAAEEGCEVTLIERNDRALKKLLSTGNGRCNLSNLSTTEQNYHGDLPFVKSALQKFGVKDTVMFFQKIGVPIKKEGNKLFPYSLQAASVSDMLRLYAEVKGVRLKTATEVKKIKATNGFVLVCDQGNIECDKVIVAVGGKAAAQLSGGGAYQLLTALGHTQSQLRPALVPVKTEGTKALAGTKTDALIRMFHKGKCIAEEKGELLFTEYGLSGPPILQLTASMPKESGCDFLVDLLPEFDAKHLLAILEARRTLSVPIEKYFTGFLKKTIGQAVIKDAGLKSFAPAASLSRDDLLRIVSCIKERKYTITGTLGWQQAQVTAGGIDCREFDEHMQSRKIHGLYAVGEVLNVHGDCGGFNLQWAWTSGIIAGKHAAHTE